MQTQQSDDELVAALSACRSLTLLEFSRCTRIFSPDQWSAIFTGAGSLTSLRFYSGRSDSLEFLHQPIVCQQLRALALENLDCPEELAELTQLPQLTSLRLVYARFDVRAPLDIVSAFSSSTVLPALERCFLEAGSARVEWTKAEGVTQWNDQKGELVGLSRETFRSEQHGDSSAASPPPSPPTMQPIR
jgi:hypothetical protein